MRQPHVQALSHDEIPLDLLCLRIANGAANKPISNQPKGEKL
jgi:hypothetical protein